MPKSNPRFVSRFGQLKGLDGLKRRTSLRLLPFVSVEVTAQRPAGSLRPPGWLRPGLGLDLRYAFSGGASVAATVNPDFGQVEQDPAVVNLSPNEVFRSEKRPFFLAGASLFRTPLTLLYTRRVGAPPVAPAPARGGVITEVDESATIAGALRLQGDQGRISYGALAAVVLPAHARETLPSGETVDRVASLGAVHGAARALVRAADGVSLGAMAVSYTPYGHTDPGQRPAGTYAGGVDWDLRTNAGWLLRGQVVGATADSGSGYGFWALAGQQGAPTLRYWLEAESFSGGYDIHRVGYQWRANMVRFKPNVQLRLAAPWRALRQASVTLWGRYAMTHDDPSISFQRELELAFWFRFTNRWELWTGLGGHLPTLDDRETRGGPAYPRPAQGYGWLGGKTDPARAIYAYGTVSLQSEGEALALSTELTLKADLLDRLTLSLAGRYLQARDFTRWVETRQGPGGTHYLFADLDLHELGLTTSALLGITRPLTLTLFGQLLYSVGVHHHPTELATLAHGTPLLMATPLRPSADFTRLTLLLNVALRYDLGGGAAAFLVYKFTGTLNRQGTPAAFPLGDDLAALGTEAHLHRVLLKVSYGWDL